jgi:hypothetical protein
VHVARQQMHRLLLLPLLKLKFLLQVMQQAPQQH